MGITSVTKKGQMTIPADIRRALDIKERDRVEVKIKGNTAIIKKVTSAADLRGSVDVGKKRGADWKKIESETALKRGRQGA